MAKRTKKTQSAHAEHAGVLIAPEQIDKSILWLRDRHVLIDADLADFYGVTTRHLNQAVKRHAGKFPADFMFRLSAGEKREVITTCDHLQRLKFSSSLPYAFTEHGVLMAASILSSPRADEVSVFVVRAFIRLREVALQHRELSQKLAELERKVGDHDEAIRQLVAAIRQLMAPPPTQPKRKIGFHAEGKK